MSDGLDPYDVVASDPLEETDDERASARGLGAFPNPDVSESPVVPLGFIGGKVVFAMPEGEIRMEPAAKIGAMLRTDIYACAAGQNFLTYWRGSDDKFMRDLATVWFVRACRSAGLWDSNRPVRSLGVWPDEGDGVVLHVGDEIWRIAAKGKPEKVAIIEALRDRRGPMYRLRPPAPRPAKAISAADGQWIRDKLDLWRFEPIGGDGLSGADVVAGWVAASMLGAVAPFRGHLMINAMAGAGKTTLVAFVHALQSALTGDVIDAFTEAGLRNDLAGMARPVLLDEAEGAPGAHGPGVVEKALELLRRMSTGSGGTRKQGDVGGGAVTQTAVGAVLLAAINPPRLGPADGSRILELRLMPLSGADLAKSAPRPAVASRADLTRATAEARVLAPGLLGRVLAGAWRYRADVDELAAAFGRAGESPRTGDLIAMVAAGRRLLLFDQALTPEEADAEVRFWAPLLAQREATEVVSNPGSDALAHLMAADAGIHVRDRRATIGELINAWIKSRDDYADTLKTHGVKVVECRSPDGRDGPWLFVANNHPKLEAIFKNTGWGDWRRSLAYLDGLGPDHKTWCTTPQNFGVGVKQRAIAIPLTPWMKARPPMPAGVVPLRSETVPPTVPEEDLDWPS